MKGLSEVDCRKCENYQKIQVPVPNLKTCTIDRVQTQNPICFTNKAMTFNGEDQAALLFNTHRQLFLLNQLGDAIIASNYEYEHCPIKRTERRN